MESDTVFIGVQVNGKVRATLEVPSAKLEDKGFITVEAQKLPELSKYLSGKEIKKTIIVPGKVISFVVV